MKNVLALCLALLLLLTGCSKAPAQADTQASQAVSTEETFVEEILQEDGIKITNYRQADENGPILREIWEYPDGSVYEGTFDAQGAPVTSKFTEADNSGIEHTFYPSGNFETTILHNADGSYQEIHYMDDGETDPATGAVMTGTITYQKYVTADGQVQEMQYQPGQTESSEDGTYWYTSQGENNSTYSARYSKSDVLMEEIIDIPDECRSHTYYYDNGKPKEMEFTSFTSSAYRHILYYENGYESYSLIISEDGTQSEASYTEEGFYTYLRIQDLQNEYEYFADGAGNLLKYAEGDAIYEGEEIPSNARDNFKLLQEDYLAMLQQSQNQQG